MYSPRKYPASWLTLLLLNGASAHMQMSWPYPVRSPFNPANNYTDIDYSYTSPLLADGSNFPCKGYQNDRPIVPVVTYEAGGTYNMTVAGSTMHGGGSCQLSLSYDNGATFRVIKSMIGGCPLSPSYDFTIPSYAPEGTALFAWTWYNLIGNRELYMDCAEVNIVSASSVKVDKRRERRRRQQQAAFHKLPFIWKANMPGIDACATVEGVTPVFPNPGPDVQYGDGFSSSSAATTGTCDQPKPFGQAYKALGDTGVGIFDGPHDDPLSPLDGPSVSSAQPTSTSSSTTRSRALTSMRTTVVLATSATSSSTKDCHPVTITVTGGSENSLAKHFRPASGCSTVTVTVMPSIQPSTSVHHHAPSRTRPAQISASHSSRVVATSSTKISKPHPTGSAPSQLPYATPDFEHFLPCVPSSYLCTSNTTYALCVSTSNTDTDYIRMGLVPAGMMCSPSSASAESFTSKVSSGGGPPGTYRNDAIVQAQPLGACSTTGELQCTHGGSQYLLCVNGAWVDMGPVAAGTKCSGTPGQIS